LKNIPNQGKEVLKKTETSDSSFNGYEDSLKDGDLKAAYAYYKIVATACGTGPFVVDDDLPEKDKNSHTVKNCLDQANKAAFAVVFYKDCGKDALDDEAVKDDCYVELANKMKDLYNIDNFDAMSIDVSGEYPYDKVFSELDAIAV